MARLPPPAGGAAVPTVVGRDMAGKAAREGRTPSNGLSIRGSRAFNWTSDLR